LICRKGEELKEGDDVAMPAASKAAAAARLTVVVPATDSPPTLERCLAAIRAADDGPDELVVVDHPPGSGPAEARNSGAEKASGDVLVFVDADVEVHRDVFRRIRAALDSDPGLTAVFGAYDDEPETAGLVSDFRNLLHHFVHDQGEGFVGTFWAGLGAIRRDAFRAAGGFDSIRFSRPSVEDIELGMRLAKEGRRILLDPSIQGKHLKRWTLTSMIETDFARRGVPWVGLLLRERSLSRELNLGWRHRLSTASCIVAVLGAVSGHRRVAPGAAVAFVALNADFYALLIRKRGLVAGSAGVLLHAVHHLTGAAALAAGVAKFAAEGWRSRTRPP
jgi:glycosyltransferase involved in cell wall biosynthesis